MGLSHNCKLSKLSSLSLYFHKAKHHNCGMCTALSSCNVRIPVYSQRAIKLWLSSLFLPPLYVCMYESFFKNPIPPLKVINKFINFKKVK